MEEKRKDAVYFVFKSNYINYLRSGKQNNKKDREMPTNPMDFGDRALQGEPPCTVPFASGLQSVTGVGMGGGVGDCSGGGSRLNPSSLTSRL